MQTCPRPTGFNRLAEMHLCGHACVQHACPHPDAAHTGWFTLTAAQEAGLQTGMLGREDVLLGEEARAWR